MLRFLLIFFLCYRRILSNTEEEIFFDWEFYLKHNSDLAISGIYDRKSAIEHFVNIGYKEYRLTSYQGKSSRHSCNNDEKLILKNPDFGRYCDLQHKLRFFDWHFYLKVNPDLVLEGITTKLQAIDHFKKKGYDQHRWSNEIELPSRSACILAVDIIAPRRLSRICNYSDKILQDRINESKTSSTNRTARINTAMIVANTAVTFINDSAVLDRKHGNDNIDSVISTWKAVVDDVSELSSKLDLSTMEVDQNNHNIPTIIDRTLLDGCRYVFIDIGSHIGMHFISLYYNKASRNDSISSIFDAYFTKNRVRSDLCAVGFESSNRLKKRHETLQKRYEKINLRVHFLNYVSNGIISSYLTKHNQRHQRSNNIDLLKNDPQNNLVTFNDNSSQDNSDIDQIDNRKFVVIIDFINRIIKNRVIPDKLYDSDPPPTVVMKIGIDGEEIDIIPALIDSGVLCDINVLTVEWCRERISTDNQHSKLKQLHTIEADLFAFQKKCINFEYFRCYDRTGVRAGNQMR